MVDRAAMTKAIGNTKSGGAVFAGVLVHGWTALDAHSSSRNGNNITKVSNNDPIKEEEVHC